MRHKYDTRGVVLARTHAGEANTFVTLLTPDLGLVHARAQSLRKSGAKLAVGLTTLAESEVMLIRGKEGWRIAGALLGENWFARLKSVSARNRASRVSGLFLRLVAGEMQNPELFSIMRGFLEALATLPEDQHEAIEVLMVLRTLAVLGLDAGDIPGGDEVSFAPPILADIRNARAGYVARINKGITASGL
ncbi:MAG: recombination protein O N-terminal domain-containing protein [Candidatus Paceibacterota bacterium]|jgi:recombinational DNA repair protein (RecF pathway)